jgi:hypothetical protein
MCVQRGCSTSGLRWQHVERDLAGAVGLQRSSHRRSGTDSSKLPKMSRERAAAPISSEARGSPDDRGSTQVVVDAAAETEADGFCRWSC